MTTSTVALDHGDDIFHAVTMTEEASWNEGYSEGMEMGKKKAFMEGYSMGATKGTEIGQEVGFYSGYAAQILHTLKDGQPKPRVEKVCEAISELANTFVDIDPMDEQLTDNLNKIQGKFKQLTSLLGVQVEYVTVSGNDKKGSSF